jgi:hypothetical protein
MSFGIKSSIGVTAIRWKLHISGDLTFTSKYYLEEELQNTYVVDLPVSKQIVVIGNEVNIIKNENGVSKASQIKGIITVKSGETINVSINGAFANKICTFNRNRNEIEFILNNHQVLGDELVIRIDITKEETAPIMGEYTAEINQ